MVYGAAVGVLRFAMRREMSSNVSESSKRSTIGPCIFPVLTVTAPWWLYEKKNVSPLKSHQAAFFVSDSRSYGCPPADGVGQPNAQVCNGNGDGKLSSPGGLREGRELWRHLAVAGYLAGTYTSAKTVNSMFTNGLRTVFNCPPVRDNSNCWDWHVTYQHHLVIWPPGWNLFTITEVESINMWIFTPSEALTFDRKYDDGIANTGTICAYDACAFSDITISPDCSVEQADGSYHYNAANPAFANHRRCGMAFDTGLYR